MKKQNLINLIRYHVENNNEAFISEVANIAKDFDMSGDAKTADYIMELVSDANFYVPQASYKNLRFLEKIDYSNNSLFLPAAIEEDVLGVVKAINKGMGINKFLFYGAPGTGKTESAYQIGRILKRDVLTVNFEQLVDSRLGETAKNVSMLFDEIQHLPYNKVIVLLDEIDAIVLDRINKNDLREMGRVTSVFLKQMDMLKNTVVIATTNLFNHLDKAMIRRFDAIVSFDRYTKEDLIEIADSILSVEIKKSDFTRQDIRLFNKILNNAETIPYPGDLKQIIRTSIAFSDESNQYDYLRKIYINLNNISDAVDINRLSSEGYTTREIEILSSVPKSSVQRKLRNS